MTPDFLTRIGRALAGARWKEEVAHLLGLHDGAAVRAMLSGRRPIRPGHILDLRQALAERRDVIDAILAEPLPDGTLHGLAPQDLDMIGHIVAARRALDGDAWLDTRAEPARALADTVHVAIADGEVRPRSDLTGRRIVATLARLADDEARHVEAAAADVHDLAPGAAE